MLSLTWMMNSAAITAIHFLLVDDYVKHCRIRKLQQMTDNAGYPFALDFLNFVDS